LSALSATSSSTGGVPPLLERANLADDLVTRFGAIGDLATVVDLEDLIASRVLGIAVDSELSVFWARAERRVPAMMID
jgi:hypothetical protein